MWSMKNFINKREFNKIIKIFKSVLLRKLLMAFFIITVFGFTCIGAITTVISYREVKSQVIQSTNHLLHQNKAYIDYIAEGINNYSVQISTNKDLLDLFNSKKNIGYDQIYIINEIEKSLNNILNNNSNLESIQIINPQGISVGVPAIGALEEDLTIDNKKLKSNAGWLAPRKDVYSQESNKLVVSYVRDIIDPGTMKSKGILFLNVKPEVFDSAFENQKVGNSGYIYILDSEGNIMYHPQKELLGKNVSDTEVSETILNNTEGSFTYKEKNTNEKMIAIYSSSSKTDWKYVAVIPYKELTVLGDKIKNTIVLISLLCLLITVVMSIKFSLSITKPINKIIEGMNRVKQGDLTAKVNLKGKDEIAILAENFDLTIERMRELVGSIAITVENMTLSSKNIHGSTRQLEQTSTEVAKVMEQISGGSSEQAEHIVEVDKTIEVFNNEISLISNFAEEVGQYAKTTMEKSSGGLLVVNDLRRKSIENTKVLSGVKNAAEELAQNTKDIEKILKKISSISDQTDLLALNAAIEAARAGEAGRGFGVVAEEVRKLSDQSKQFALEINSLIKDMQIRSSNAEEMSQATFLAMKDQENSTENLLKVFNQITDVINHTTEKVEILIEKIRKIDNEKEGIMKDMNGVANVAQGTAAATEEVNASTEEQIAYVEEINSMVEKLHKTSIDLKNITNQFIV
jgi:methyl-accepting chemotaxis protein